MIVEPLNDEHEWEEFVAASPDGTFFHTLKWRDVLEKSFSYESSYLCIRDSNEQLVGVCPFFITNKLWPFKVLDSLPFSDLGGPLFKDGFTTDAAIALMDFLKTFSITRGISYTKLKLSNLEVCKSLAIHNSKVEAHSGTMILDLYEKPIDFIWNKVFTKKGGQRRLIRRFENDGFQSREATSYEDFNKFYNLYSEHKNSIDALPFSRNHFNNIWSSLYPDNFNILLVEKGDECIGASAFFIYKELRAIYLCYVGYEKEILSNRYNYSYYARWKEIEWAHKNGFRYISLGYAPNDPNSVYYSRKRSFGCEFNQTYYLYIPYNKKLFLVWDHAISVGRKTKHVLPKWLLMKINKRL